MQASRGRPTAAVSFLFAAAVGVDATRAAVPSYHITALGLTDTAHTGPGGAHRSRAALVNAVGQVVGFSSRPVSDSWVETSAWHYDSGVTTKIGLYDAQHTNADGFQSMDLRFLNDAGVTVGESRQFSGNEALGFSTWVYRNGTTTPAGLFDSLHTDIDGKQESEARFLNQSGQLVGTSRSYPPSSFFPGFSAWLFENGVTTRIGLLDAAHTHPTTGSQTSAISGLNNAGQILGNSERYVGSVTRTVWLRSGGVTTTLGLTDSEHTGPFGQQHSFGGVLNEAGHVAGTSERYVADEDEPGRSAWFYNGTTTTNIGFTDTAHTAANGTRWSVAELMNQASQVVGFSLKFVGNDSRGETEWIYSGGTRTPIGLYDAEHTSPTGDNNTFTMFLTDSGRAAGIAFRYPDGNSAWVYDGATTHRAGLLDPLHNNFGKHNSSPVSLNEAGVALGTSQQMVITGPVGQSTWIHDAGVTTRIGLVDDLHTRNNGTSESTSLQLNEAGQAIGLADRFASNDVNLGVSGWFYDHTTHATTPLVFSTNGLGEAFTFPDFLTEDGVVLGAYRKYDGGSSSIEPFYWSLADGFHDLNTVVGDGGLAANGWFILREAEGVAGTKARFIIGQGLTSDFNDRGYLLSLPGGGSWINPAGGSWHGGANWGLGAPTTGDDAIFNLNAIYSVGFPNNAAAHDLNVTAGTVLFDLFGHSVNVRGTTNVSAQLALVGGVLRTGAVNVTGAGQLDLGDGDMIVDYTGASPLAAVTNLIATGKIMTSAFIEASSTLGIADNSVLGLTSFSGQQVDSTSVLVKYTYHGDADLNGRVDVADLGALASHWQSAGVWTDGDFDYNGSINVNDLGLLASNWQAGVGNPLGPSIAEALAAFGLPSTAVPEPHLQACWASQW